MLTTYRRHRKSCNQRHDGRRYRRCLCPIWVDGLLNGVKIRKSLKTRDWQAAHQLVRFWEAEGKREERSKPIVVKDACDKFISDAEARGFASLRCISIGSCFASCRTSRPHTDYRAWFNSTWIVRRFRASWPNKNIAARKKLEALRAFLRFVHESGWIPTNPASRIEATEDY